MSLIKLFSGMDFSGKTTLIRCIDSLVPGKFQLSKKFITPVDTLQRMIDHNIWIPPEEFIPLLETLVIKDISSYQDQFPILQDTLWVIKFTARLMAENSDTNKSQITNLLGLIEQYPQMDSFYVTVSMEERLNRYLLRSSSGNRISSSDKMLFDKQLFEEVERWYRFIIFNKFPNTLIIDTTSATPHSIASRLIETFSRDLGGVGHGSQ